MNKDNLVSKIQKGWKNLKRTLAIAAVMAVPGTYAISQNTLSGRLTTMPTLEPALARVTVRDTLTGFWKSDTSNNQTGEYSLTDLPSGRYKVTIEFQSIVNGSDTTRFHFSEKFEDINTNKTIDLVGYKFDTSKSTYEGFKGKSILEIHKIMTLTRGPPFDGGSVLYRAPNVQKINLRRHNPNDSWSMPLEWEAEMQRSQDSIEAAAEGHFRYEETTTDTSEGLVYSYRPNNEMTHPWADAETIPFWDVDKFLLYKANIEMNRDILTVNSVYSTNLRERGRGMGLFNIADNTSFMGPGGSGELNPNDKLIIRNNFCTPEGTDYAWYWTDSVVTRDITTDVKLEDITSTIPVKYLMQSNYPNPFNPETTIPIDIPNTSNVKMEVYNSLGQLVETLIDQRLAPGKYNVKYHAVGPSGTYFFKIEADDGKKKYEQINKGILLK